MKNLSGVGGVASIRVRDKHWYHRQLFYFLIKLGAVKPEHGIPGLRDRGFTITRKSRGPVK